ncbi:origin recognition complex subunit 5 C-terminus-domain-containing protein [Mrakia frigida]|uniref:origin recognition complex subunit 5 n=1 Tax=Mrakia frigida TaxID=29902 RepID=UPI003FCBEED8
MSSSPAVPPPLSSLLLPYLSPPHLVPFLFFHPHLSIQPLLSLLLPSLLALGSSASSLSSPGMDGPSPSSTRAQPPPRGSFALVDAIEFGGSTKGFMEEVMRQWGMNKAGTGRKWLGWEAFVKDLEEMDDKGDQQQRSRLLVVDRVEKLRGPSLGFGPGGLASSLASLGTMTSKSLLTIVFLSPTPWDSLRPIPSTFPDPPIVSIPAFSPQETVTYLLSNPPLPPTSPLFTHYQPFLTHLYSIASPYHLSPLVLLRLAHSLWPVYIAPLSQPNGPHQLAHLPSTKEGIALHLSQRCREAFQVAISDPTALPGSLDQFRRAEGAAGIVGLAKSKQQQDSLTTNLPRMAKFLLIAAFLASYNPPRKDLMFFGRGRWEGGGKKKKGGGTRKATSGGRKGTVAKIPQTILGPKPFPLDRLIAIFGSLLAEHDRPDSSALRDEQWEEEVGEIMASVSVRALISNLVGLHLLQRTSPPDRLDGIMLKSELGWEEAVALGRGLKIRVEDWWAGDD